MQAGIANAQAKMDSLPTEIESCGCPPGNNPVNGECEAEPTCKGGKILNAQGKCECPLGEISMEDGGCKPGLEEAKKPLEVTEWPYSMEGWATIIGIAVGILLAIAGFFVNPWLWITVGAIVAMIAGVLAINNYLEWAKQRKKAIMLMDYMNKIQAAGGTKDNARELQREGQIPDNDYLIKAGFSDDELRALGLL